MNTDRFLYFDILDYRNVETITSYALPETPFKFIPRFDSSVSDKRVLWKFGDSNTSNEISPSHAYELPGIYKVELFVFDLYGQSIINSYVKNVTVVDYIPDNIVLTQTLSTIEAGVFENPFTVVTFNSYRNSNLDILLHVDDDAGQLLNTETYNKEKYAHLVPYSAFYIRENDENIPVNSITIESTKLFRKIENGDIIVCNEEDTGSFFVGTSGTKDVYFVGDIPSLTPVNIFARFDLKNVNDYQSINKDYANILEPSYSILQQITAKTRYKVNTQSSANFELTITANGIDTFIIDKNKFINTEIPFVIKIVNQDNYHTKYFDTLTYVLSSETLSEDKCHIVAIDGEDQNVPCIINDLTPSNEHGGYFKGTVSFPITATNVFLSAAAIVDSNIATGTSNSFNVYDENGEFKVAKIGENIDFTDLLKSYRTQQILIESPQLFDNFIGSIVGNLSSDPNTIGKKIYEKITNFVDNSVNIDTCNVSSLASIYQMLGDDITLFDRYNFTYPAAINRLIDLFSIKQSILWGTNDKTTNNFDRKGYINSELYGTNLGDKLDLLTTTLTAGALSKPIVAYEKFSKTYKLVNTNLLESDHVPMTNDIYPLSAYNEYWGWGLVLPDVYEPSDISKYYEFYTFNDTTNNKQVEGIINWDDFNTTITKNLSSISEWNDIQEKMLTHQFIRGLNMKNDSV